MRTVTKSNAESVMKRYCLFCNKELDGRPDKKFCHYNCRNTYNNKNLKNKSSKKTEDLITYSYQHKP